jgi:hypothetical protein
LEGDVLREREYTAWRTIDQIDSSNARGLGHRGFVRDRSLEEIERDMGRGLNRSFGRELDIDVDRSRFRPGARTRRHDAMVLPEVRWQIAKLREQGARDFRVISESELRGEMSSRGNRTVIGRPGNAPFGLEDRRRVARDMNLRVVNDRVMLPDARIKYRDIDGRERHLDLEITTREYSRRQIGAKSAAGFSVRSELSIRNETKARDPLREKRGKW